MTGPRKTPSSWSGSEAPARFQSARRTCPSSGWDRTPTTRCTAPRAIRTTRRRAQADRPEGPARRSPPGFCRWPTAAISADRCAILRASTTSSASVRRSVWCPTAPTPLPFAGFGVKGPMARSVADVAFLMSVMAGRIHATRRVIPSTRRRSPHRSIAPFKGVRVAWCPDLGGLPIDPARAIRPRIVNAARSRRSAAASRTRART